MVFSNPQNNGSRCRNAGNLKEGKQERNRSLKTPASSRSRKVAHNDGQREGAGNGVTGNGTTGGRPTD